MVLSLMARLVEGNFYSDMGDMPSTDHQLDRRDNSKGYTPENCRWVTAKQNGRNKRNNVIISYKGANYCLSELIELKRCDYKDIDINYTTLRTRIKNGMDVDKAFTTPVGRVY